MFTPYNNTKKIEQAFVIVGGFGFGHRVIDVQSFDVHVGLLNTISTG